MKRNNVLKACTTVDTWQVFFFFHKLVVFLLLLVAVVLVVVSFKFSNLHLSFCYKDINYNYHTGMLWEFKEIIDTIPGTELGTESTVNKYISFLPVMTFVIPIL